MLTHLDIHNFAIIKSLSTDFHEGLNIITGETGAGKSVIIEAVSMALGSRADTDYIRNGEAKAEITLTVDTDGCDISSVLDEYGIPDDNPMVLHREISSGSKSLCRINGSIVPLSVHNKLCKKLADIHGQYDHQNLLNPDNHISVLDAFGGFGISILKENVFKLYHEFVKTNSELLKLKKQIGDSERQKDFLRFELSEIESSGLKPGEDEELEQKIKLMENSERIFSSVSDARAALFTSEYSALGEIGKAIDSLKNVSDFSKDIDNSLNGLNDIYYQLDDINSVLRHLGENITFSREELDNAIERQNLINNLKRKYGGSVESVLQYAVDARKKIETIENSDELMSFLEKKVSEIISEYKIASGQLTEKRKEIGSILQNKICIELSELNFKNAEFSVEVRNAEMSENGVDNVEFMISANKGETLKPLAKVASGGELSRIMLAMKRIIGDTDNVQTMIFDEIDTGISGATAGIVGNKLKSISTGKQVICITHLPQIACLGDHHYRITKLSDESSTSTTIMPLETIEDRTEEIARLLSGEIITNAARTQAKELLNGKY